MVNNGSAVDYTPAADFFGTEVFTYTISDGHGGYDTAIVTVNVTGSNDAPLAVNDTDVEGDSLTAVLDSGPVSGSLVLNADGSFVYTPTLGYTGALTFTYTARDGMTPSAPATVTITVAAAPVTEHKIYLPIVIR